MTIVLRFLALPYFAVAGILVWWICKCLPAGWRRNLNGLTAAIVLFTLAYWGWQETLGRFTSGRYVCLDCGRTEDQRHFASWAWSRTLVDDGAAFQRRFLTLTPQHQEHKWHLESCLFHESGVVACTKECIEGWFHVLPMLKDRAAADALVAEAARLQARERCALMDELSFTWYEAREGRDVDESFAKWRAERK